MIVRADLPEGVRAAQIIHAAGESTPGRLPCGTFAFALAVPDEPALVREAERLRARGFVQVDSEDPMPAHLCDIESQSLAFVPIYEPDAPYDGAMMAIALVPRRREVLRRHVSSLPKLK